MFTTIFNFLKGTLCLLNFNHTFSKTAVEEGKGTDFRYIRTCSCGKQKDVGNWTDDNHALGYGTK